MFTFLEENALFTLKRDDDNVFLVDAEQTIIQTK